jgi:hypothetical protein
MPRRGPRRITVIGVGTPPTLTREMLRPLAMEILHRWEAKQAAERQAERERKEGHHVERRRAL